MRISTYSIAKFKNLSELEVHFTRDSPISVVVGRNGTGKSNLLESLAILFRDLDRKEVPKFGFQIVYESRGDEVTVECDPNARTKISAKLNGTRISLAKLRGEDDQERHLPDFVFGYYSGPSNRLRQHFQAHQDSFNRALRDGTARPLRRLFYAEPVHSQFVLLAFYLSASDDDRRFLREFLRIVDFESVLFVLREPSWTSKQGDSRFWRARGVVADLLSEVFDRSLAPVRTRETPAGTSNPREFLYLFLKDLKTVKSLAEFYGNSSQELFKAFESILAADLLSEVRVRVKAPGVQNSLVFRELSEGEQQLLMVLGLLRFTRGDESLFLLDEPDTHLNPAWSVSYTSMLEAQTADSGTTSQILTATHDPLVISSLLREQVVLLERDNESGRVVAGTPSDDPRGMGVSGLLTSEIYGLASELDAPTLQKLERHRWLASADDGVLSDVEQEELGLLTSELEALDFSFSDRDPLYSAFERAMRSVERTSPVLDPEMVRSESVRASATVRRLLDEA